MAERPAAQGGPVGYPVAYGGNPPNPTPPPPSQSITPQYATWLVDGPEGRGFAYYLSEGYRRYAKLEDNAHDFEDAAKFLFRAGEVDRGRKRSSPGIAYHADASSLRSR